VNQAHQIVTQNLAKRLVKRSSIRLRPQGVSEFPLQHAERGFDVAPLVVMRQKFIPLEHEVMEHLLPKTALLAGGFQVSVTPERDKGVPPAAAIAL